MTDRDYRKLRRGAKDIDDMINRMDEAYARGEKAIMLCSLPGGGGDGLAEFIYNEIKDVCSPQMSLLENYKEALEAMTTARDQLNRVVNVLTWRVPRKGLKNAKQGIS